MAQKKNKNNKSGQLVRQNQKTTSTIPKNPNSSKNMSLGTPSMGAAVAYSNSITTLKPKVNSNTVCTRVVHRELIATVSGNTTYGVTAYALNPGLSSVFPWLASVAGNYEQYTFRSLRFFYITRCATSYAGSVLLSPEYDALDSSPTSEVFQAMMAGSVEDVPWRDQVLTFSVKDMFPMGPRKFVRSGVVSSSDLKTYDVGQLFVGLAGCTDTNTIGKLWVEYDVELYIPQNPGATVSGGVGSSALLTLAVQQNLTTATPVTIAFDTVAYDGITVVNTSGSIVLPSGTYSIIPQVTSSLASLSTVGTVVIEIRKDGSASSPVYKSTSKTTLAGSIDAGFSQSVLGNFVSTGSNAVSILITATATATLTLPANQSQIRILRIA